MDTVFTRLDEATHAGDVNSLNELLMEDQLLLEKVIVRTPIRDNPLHIASLIGHAEFARELISQKAELAMEFDRQGFTPLHLAVAHGHVAVVQELLKAGLGLCLLRERKEGFLPLHIAVIKGRPLIVKELLEASEDTLHQPTFEGETILHLAMKYNSLDALEFSNLIDRVSNLNAKDNKGNTILHLAVANKQLSAIKVLLSKPRIDVNPMNLKGFTPLDVLLGSRLEYGDLVLGEIIRAAGGKTAAEVLSNSQPVFNDSISTDNSNPTLQIMSRSNSREDVENASSEYEQKQNNSKFNPNMLMVVATLVATVTFQGAINPPGGFLAEDVPAANPPGGSSPEDESDQLHFKGEAVLGQRLDIFLFFDMLALFLSVSVILLFLCVIPRKRKIVIKFLVWVVWLATFSMALAYTTAISTIFPDQSLVIFWIEGWLAVLLLGILWVWIRFIIFILKKGELWEPIGTCFLLLKRGGLLRYRRLAEATNAIRPKCCQLLITKKTISIVLVICVIFGPIFCSWKVYSLLNE